ncbi:MAG: alpha/beta hydrolase domain-containing protein [Gammaproteobacteria bacterium]
MPQTLNRFAIPCLLSAMLCAHALADVTTELLPITPGDPETRSTPFIAWFEDLTEVGYREEEYLVAGTANLYNYTDDAGQRPDIEVVQADVPYVTRMLVRRPDNAADFNGSVYVEVLNATAGWDGDPIWQSTYEHIVREGAVWVGVSTKPVTVDFLRDSWGQDPWPPRNTERYATLSMPDFGQVWDMLTQIGTLLKSPSSADNPLTDLSVAQMIMVGYSQSAAYQVTYANSFHSTAQLPGGGAVYDGYYISAGGASAKHVRGPTDTTPENLVRGDDRNLTRVDAPVIRFQTQTEVVNFPSFPVRQSEEDYPLLRFYEMAGGSHVDAQLNAVGGQALVRDLGLPPSFCPAPEIPYNPIRIGYVQSALFVALERWIGAGATPPASRFMALTTDDDGNTVLARDANGNGIDGIRVPNIEAPVGTYVESNDGPGFCGLFGGFAPFDDATLDALYPSREAYLTPFKRAAINAINDGFLLRPDALTLMNVALESGVGDR